MADATYLPKVYRKHGAEEFVIASGGALTIETGGTLTHADGIPRAQLATESKFIDLEERLKGADGADLALSETAGDFFRALGTNQWFIDGEATINETEASV